MHVVLFSDPVQREAFVALVEHDSVHDAVETASPGVAGVLRRVTVEEPLPGDPELGDPIDSVVTVLVQAAVRRALADMEARNRTEGEEVPWQQRAVETAQVRLWLDELDDPTSWRDAVERLVAWLDDRERN
jgi:hypothetical protein